MKFIHFLFEACQDLLVFFILIADEAEIVVQ